MIRVTIILMTLLLACQPKNQKVIEATPDPVVSQEKLLEIYEEVKTPYKYGVVFQHPDTTNLHLRF